MLGCDGCGRFPSLWFKPKLCFIQGDNNITQTEKYPLALLPLKTWQLLLPYAKAPRLSLCAKNNPTAGGVGSFWHFFFFFSRQTLVTIGLSAYLKVCTVMQEQTSGMQIWGCEVRETTLGILVGEMNQRRLLHDSSCVCSVRTGKISFLNSRIKMYMLIRVSLFAY